MFPVLNGWIRSTLIIKHDNNKLESMKRKLSLISNLPSLPLCHGLWSHGFDELNFWIIKTLSGCIFKLCVTPSQLPLQHGCHQSNLEVSVLPPRLTVYLSTRHEMHFKVSKKEVMMFPPPESGSFDALLTRNAWNDTSLKNRMSPLETVFQYLCFASHQHVNPVCPGLLFGPRHQACTLKDA